MEILGIVAWVAINTYVTIGGLLAICFGALDRSSMFGKYATWYQKFAAFAILVIIVFLWVWFASAI